MSTKRLNQLIIQGQSSIENGLVNISGSKNATLPILAASMLATKPIKLIKVPGLTDTHAMLETLCTLGANICLDENMSLHIDTKDCLSTDIPIALAKKLRTSFLFLGPMLARYKKAHIPLPGGCKIGARPVDIHIEGLRRMGAEIVLENQAVTARAPNGLYATDFDLPFPSVTGTENLIMAASTAQGTTILRNAAKDPEVEDLINFLNKIGADITGQGTSTITIKGKKTLSKSATHTIIGDRIEAGTYLIATTICQGNILIKGINPEHLTTVLQKLMAAGAKITTHPDAIQLEMNKRPTATSITTKPYPGFPTDLQAQWLTLNCIANGDAYITEEIYENRLAHAYELKKLQANIKIVNNTVFTTGAPYLKGGTVNATDIRASASLVLAGLIAKGETLINNIQYLDRGYNYLEENLNRMGCNMKRVHQPICKKKQYKTIIFDWDGTLVHSLPLLLKSHQETIQSLNLPPHDEATLEQYIGESDVDIVSKLYPSMSTKEIQAYLELFIEYYVKNHSSIQLIHNQTKKALAELFSHGIDLCIATNKRRKVFQEELSITGISNFISASYCGDEMPKKPQPDMLMALCKKMNTEPEYCLMVGDHQSDLLAAQSVGMKTLAVTTGGLTKKILQHYNPSDILENVTQIPHWLGLTH